MTDQLKDIHLQFRNTIAGRYALKPVSLKHPFPERPLRALGIIKIDGSVHETEKLMRVMVLTTQFLTGSRCSRSIFLGPRPELHLPLLSSETILMGAKRAFLVDIHTTVRQERWSALNIEDRLLAIRSRYPQLLAKPLTLKGKINDIMSKAHCYWRCLLSLTDRPFPCSMNISICFWNLSTRQSRPRWEIRTRPGRILRPITKRSLTTIPR